MRATLGFRHHVGLKVVSIALAFLLWLVVSGEQTVERSFRIPLEFANVPSQFEIVGAPPDLVDVRVKGSSGLLSRVGASDLSAVIDLMGATAGRRLFPLMGNQIRVPFGLEVVQVSPSTVALALEASSVRVVPIVPNVEGDPAAGFVVGTVVAEPATVELIGPSSAIKDVREAVTEPVSVTAAAAPVTATVTVGPPVATVRLRRPLRARVSVGIVQAPVEWAVARVPIRTAGGRGMVVSPATVVVHVRGPREAVTSSPRDFEATVNLEGLGPGDLLVPVRVVAPEHVGVVKVDPPEVRVRIR